MKSKRKRKKAWFRATVEIMRGFGCGTKLLNAYVFTTTVKNTRKRIRKIIGSAIYDLGRNNSYGIWSVEIFV